MFPTFFSLRLNDELLATLSGLVVCWAIGGANDGPRHIGAQVLAAHGAMGGGLNGWAVFGWYVATPNPVMYRLGRHADGRGKRHLRAEYAFCAE